MVRREPGVNQLLRLLLVLRQDLSRADLAVVQRLQGAESADLAECRVPLLGLRSAIGNRVQEDIPLGSPTTVRAVSP